MTRQAQEPSSNIHKIALLVSLACVLQICESLIPHPIPGLRLGLANVITLIALDSLGFRYALEVTVLRTLLSSFIMGTFMSPAFILSFAGGVVSTFVMGCFFWLSGLSKHYRLSIIGISMLGALSHNLVQLYLAYLILVRHAGIFIFLPWLCIGAVITGWVTGLVSARVCRDLKEKRVKQEMPRQAIRADYPAVGLKYYLPANTLLNRLPAQIKIAAIFILSLLTLIFNNLWFCLGLLLFLAALAAISQASPAFLLLRAKKYSSLLVVSFLFPVFFNPAKHALEGLSTGALFAWRVLFLILISALLARTTSAEELAKGLAKILSPLRPLGISNERIAAILSLSWMSVPFFWEMTKDAIRKAGLKRVKNLHSLIPVLSGLIVTLYYLEIVNNKKS